MMRWRCSIAVNLAGTGGGRPGLSLFNIVIKKEGIALLCVNQIKID